MHVYESFGYFYLEDYFGLDDYFDLEDYFDVEDHFDVEDGDIYLQNWRAGQPNPIDEEWTCLYTEANGIPGDHDGNYQHIEDS